jgi:hypothetical protein
MKNAAATLTLVALMAISGMAEASLSIIGSADYAGSNYNLIYENDAPNGSIVWLDYSNAYNNWNNQVAWASNLLSTLSNIKLNTGVNVTWNSDWRLPTTVDGPDVYDYNGTTTAGYNKTNSEFGYLYYTELQNKGAYDKNRQYQDGYGLTNKGPFANLQKSGYWSRTEYAIDPYYAWYFNTNDGDQNCIGKYYHDLGGIAVRSAVVTEEATPTPIPSAAWLFSSGLMGLFGFRKKKM